jgi:putative salt-induced outer membrane protein
MLKTNLAVIMISLSTTAFAEELRQWEVEVELGAIATSGNTQTTSLHSKLNAKQNLTKFKNEYIVSSLYKKDEVFQDDNTKSNEKTADKYLLSAKSAYLLEGGTAKSEEKSSYLFGFASYTHDEFGAYETYETVALGYGDWLYASESFNWFAEAGPGYFRGEKISGLGTINDPYTSTTEQGALLRLASEIEWKFSQTAVFKQILSIESGSDNTRTLSETSVAASITNAMQMKIGFAVANDSKVSPGKEKTDTTTSATIVYKF